LLCTNSKLGHTWRTNPQSVSITDLIELGFSPDFATTRLATIRSVRGHTVFPFQFVAAELQNVIWDGEPPHPPEDVVKQLVVTARGKDRERDGA
jgi:hypothetical protein